VEDKGCLVPGGSRGVCSVRPADNQLLHSAPHCAALVTGTTFRTAAVGVKKCSLLSLTVVFVKADKPRVNVRDRQTDIQSDGANSNQIRLTAFYIQGELLQRICDAQDLQMCTVKSTVMAFKGGQHIRAINDDW
jgi:hypothetical protein